MSKRILCIVATAFLALAASACGPSFTPEEAAEECTRLRNDLVACFDDTSYAECVSCHEECGRDCSIQEGCPVLFSCN